MSFAYKTAMGLWKAMACAAVVGTVVLVSSGNFYHVAVDPTPTKEMSELLNRFLVSEGFVRMDWCFWGKMQGKVGYQLLVSLHCRVNIYNDH